MHLPTGRRARSGGRIAVSQARPRYHIDFETDDVEAETARLVKLGVVEQARWLDCRTLRVPGGRSIRMIPVGSDA